MKGVIMICILSGLMLIGMASIGLAKEDVWEKKAAMPTARMSLSTRGFKSKMFVRFYRFYRGLLDKGSEEMVLSWRSQLIPL